MCDIDPPPPVQQNMEIHLKIKRSKRELEALENQEKEVSVRGFEKGYS